MPVVDYGLEPQSSKESGGTGIITCFFSFVPNGLFWAVDRISVKSDSATPTTCTVYVGQIADEYIMDQTNAGNLNIADETSPIYVPPGQQLIIQWTGASVGAVGKATVQYQVRAPDDLG